MSQNNFSVKINVTGHPGEAFFALKERVFELRDVGIEAKLYRDWKAQGILPITLDDNSLYNKKVRLNYYEAIWMMLISDLRRLGVRYQPHLKFFKENSWRAEDISFPKSWLAAYQQFKYPGNEALASIIEKCREEDAEELSKDIPGFQVYGFEFRIFFDLITKQSSRIFIRSDNVLDIIVNKESEIQKPPYLHDAKGQEKFMNEVFVEVPLMRYISRLVADEQLIHRQVVTGTLSKEEEELLGVIRKGQIKTLEIHFDKTGKKPISYHIEKEKVLSADEFAAVRNTILLKDYQQISYKAIKGGGAYFTKKILKNLKP